MIVSRALALVLVVCLAGCYSQPETGALTPDGPVSSDPPTTAPATSPPAAVPSPGTVSTTLGRIKAPPPQRIGRTDEFGRVVEVRAGSYVVVDRVDMLGGEEAEREARKRGDEVANDYYLVNDSTRTRRYPLSPDVEVLGSIVLSRTVDHQPSTVARLAEVAGEGVLFHLRVDDGVVTAVEEQYRP